MKSRQFFSFILSLSFLLVFAMPSALSREVYPLTTDWRLFSSWEVSGDDSQSITLPHNWRVDPAMPLSRAMMNYVRTLYVPADWVSQRLFIKFYGVHNVANLIVNGHHVGEHRGGATAFSFEITPYVEYDKDNLIIVRVNSTPQVDILPTSVEQQLYGGIYRDVELIRTPRTAISPAFHGSDGVFVTTTSIDEKSEVKGNVSVHFVTPAPISAPVERRLEISILDSLGREVFNRKPQKVRIDGVNPIVVPFSIKHITPWSSDNPTLYRVVARLSSVESGNNELVDERDEVSVTTGFRTITVANDGRTPETLKINGEATLLRGVSLYHDHPFSGGVLSQATYRSDISIVQDLGANAVRSAVMPHDQYLYSMCDSLGVMAWVDLPFTRAPYLSDIAYFRNSRFEENGIQQLREIIYQNYNHPSIVMWGLFSLLSPRGDDVVKYLTELNREAKRLDATRPTVAVSNQNGDLNNVSDLIVWRQNIGWSSGQFSDIDVWRRQLHTKWGTMRSGVIYGEGGSTDHQIDRSEIPVCRLQNREGWYPEVRQSAMHEEYASHLNADSLFWGVWATTLFDFKSPRSRLGENVEGLVSYDRSRRKDAYYLYRALWRKDSATLHIADRRARMVGQGDSILTLRVYSSVDSVAPVAYINGERREMQRVAPSQFTLDSMLVTNRTNVVVEQGDQRDSVEFIYGSPLRNQER